MAGSFPQNRSHSSQKVVWEVSGCEAEECPGSLQWHRYLKDTVIPKVIIFMNRGLCFASEFSWKYIVGHSELEHFLIIKRLIN